MRYFTLICFFALNIWLVYCKITNHVKCYKVECKFSEKFIANGSCHLRAVNRHSTAFSSYGYLKEPLDNFVGTLKAFRRYNTFAPFPIELKINPCGYLNGNGRKTSILYNVAKLFIDKYTNFNHSCPLMGEIIVKDLEFIPESVANLTTIMPQGIYRFDASIYKGTEDNFIASISSYVEVKEVDSNRPYI